MRRSRTFGWLLLTIAVAIMLMSLPDILLLLRLANQEYLHIWDAKRLIYDLEFNGQPVTIEAAIRLLVVSIICLWAVAAGLIVGARVIMRNSGRERSVPL